ncbi:MAG: EAL domain-containing protein [Lysobacter sp.]|nr:EAL domain-containing protein [Lysobacter sp.]
MNGPSPASQPVDTASVLASLENAARDQSTPEATRALLQQARHALESLALQPGNGGRRTKGPDGDRREDTHLHFRELMDVIDTAVVLHDVDGRIIYANAAAMRIFNVEEGLSLEQELLPSRWQVVDENGVEIAADELPAARALRTGRTVASTVLGLYNRRLRQLTWLSGTAVPHMKPGCDRPHQVLSMFSDVTALKRDSDLFDRAQALAHIGGWEWDAGRNRLYLTQEAKRIFDRDPAPATLGAMLDCLLESDRRQFQRAIDYAMAYRRSFDLQLQGRRSDGHTFWVHAIGQAEVGDPGNARVTGTLQDITAEKQAQATLQVQARTDPLSGLLNRDALLFELDQRLADPTQNALAVLYVDLDRFKLVNDMLGHAAGDRLLVSAAQRIQQAVGSEGLIGRFGGDEFLVICAIGDDPGRPPRLADAILAAFAESFRLQGEEFSITASIGVAQSPENGRGSQQLIQNADVAMYDSKRRGRNSWQVFTSQLQAQEQERLQLETHLRRAIGNGEFNLVYQPQIELSSGRLLAAEALIRWHNPALGQMSPDRFISHAETSGDIVEIGSWVLNEACTQLRRWQQDGLSIERVAVNVSYRQFMGPDLIDIVSQALKKSGLPGSALELEFTERVLIEDDPDTLRTFAALRDLGVMLTIDDFGEGYSALNYLRRLPIHGLKLSQSFVQGVPGNRSDVAVCQAVAGIARSLNLGLVAEGVESEEQRDFLLGLGVDIGQGYLYAPGLDPDALHRQYRPPEQR